MFEFGLGALRNSFTIGRKVNVQPGGFEIFDFSAGILPSGVSIRRASEAHFFNHEGNLELAGVNTARFGHDSVSREFLGLLIENEGRNTMQYSNADVEHWRSSNLGSEAVDTLSLGILNGVHVSSTGLSWGQFRTSCYVEADVTNIVTVYIQSGQGNKLRILVSSGLGSPLASGTFGNLTMRRQGPNIEMQIRDQILLADGMTWQIQLEITSSSSANINIGFGPDSSTAGDNFTILAAQTEAAGAPSSYITTRNTPVNRAQDYVVFEHISGIFDLNLLYAKNETIMLPGVSITSGEALALPPGHLLQITAN